MNKLLLCVLCVLALFAAVVPCFADTVNGVLAEERVVNLPNDQGKWYISVVGNANDARYNEVLGWFETQFEPGQAEESSPFLSGDDRYGDLQGTLRRQRQGAADRADAEGRWHGGLRGVRQRTFP